MPVAVSPERIRCAAILNHPEAVGREALAKHLALETDVSPATAVAQLMAAARAPTGAAASAMAGASIARAALGLAPDPAADAQLAAGIAATLGRSTGTDPAATARQTAEYEEGARTARELLGGR